jgi:nitroreductase
MELLEALNWRYAAKKLDPARAVPPGKIERILEAVRLAPTSSGLQPFEVILVTNPEVRARIKAIARNQSQVADCSHLLVFAAWDTYTAERINMMFDLHRDVRGFSGESWELYRKLLLDNYVPRSPEDNFQHIARQAYIAFGVALVAAAMEEVDAAPIEGFDANALDQILGLPARGLKSVLLLPLGYRDADNDWLVKLKKVRRPREDFVIEVR